MKWMSFVLFSLSALIHIGFFILESVMFQKTDGYKIFKIKESDHHSVKIWALNQGFYNLFLAIQMIFGLYFVLIGRREAAGLLVGFSGMSMILAGLVLFFSAQHLRRGALVQMIPPAIGFIFLAFHIVFI